MAQLVEHILGKDEVPSSNLGSSSRQPRGNTSGLWFLNGKIVFWSFNPALLGSDTAEDLSRREHLVLYSSNLGSSSRLRPRFALGALVFKG